MKYKSKKSFSLILGMVAMLCATCMAEEVTFTENRDGSYGVDWKWSKIGKVSKTSIKLSSPFSESMAELFGDAQSIDFTKGKLMKGPATIAIGRSDSSAVTYEVVGNIFAFPQPKTFLTSQYSSSMTGVVLFENSEGEIIVDSGAVSIIKMEALLK